MSLRTEILLRRVAFACTFRGEVMVDGGSIVRNSIEVHPAYGLPCFALASVAGAAATVALAINLLRQPTAL